MKYSMNLDPGKTMTVSEMRRLLARVLSKLDGGRIVTKLNFSVTALPAFRKPDLDKKKAELLSGYYS
jgi:hypothetical protein